MYMDIPKRTFNPLLIIAVIFLFLAPLGISFDSELTSVNKAMSSCSIKKSDGYGQISRALQPTNLTVAYNSEYMYFYIEVKGDRTVIPDNADSVTILIDGDRDGQIKPFDTPRNQVKDFGMEAYAGFNSPPYQQDKVGWLVEDSGTEDRDEDLKYDNPVLAAIDNGDGKNYTFRASERNEHRIYEIRLKAGRFGYTLDANTKFNIFIRVTNFNETNGLTYTVGGLTGASKRPEDLQWYELNFSNPGEQEVVVNDVTGNEPFINNTAMPGEWPATVHDIYQNDCVPRVENPYVIYPGQDQGLMADNESMCTLVAEVLDTDGNYDVEYVYSNMTELDLSLRTELADNGTQGDLVANDGNYSFKFKVPRGTEDRNYIVKIFAYGPWGNIFQNNVELAIITILPMNYPPQINMLAPTTIYMEEDSNPVYLDPYEIFYDAEGDDVQLRIMDENGSWGLEYDSPNMTVTFIVNLTFRITPKPNIYMPPGTFDAVTFRASDIMGSITWDVNISINSTNDEPEIVSNKKLINAKEDKNCEIIIVAKDTRDPEDTLTLTTNLSEAIPGVEIGEKTVIDPYTNTYTYTLNFTPDNDLVGYYSVWALLEDDDEASLIKDTYSEYLNFTVDISNTNDKPVFLGFNNSDDSFLPSEDIEFQLNEEEATFVYVNVHDDDLKHGGEFLSFELIGQDPDRIYITKRNATVARISYVPKTDFNGLESFKVRVLDGEEHSDKTISFNIKPVNDEPVITHWEIWTEVVDKNPNSPEIENMNYTFYVRDKTLKEMVIDGTVFDVDGDQIEFGWMIFKQSNNQTISWDNRMTGTNGTKILLHNFNSEGVYDIVLLCNDGNESIQEVDRINITVTPYIPGDDDDDDNNDKKTEEMPFTMIIIISIIVVITVILAIFLLSRRHYHKVEEKENRKKEEEERRIMEVAFSSSGAGTERVTEADTKTYEEIMQESTAVLPGFEGESIDLGVGEEDTTGEDGADPAPPEDLPPDMIPPNDAPALDLGEPLPPGEMPPDDAPVGIPGDETPLLDDPTPQTYMAVPPDDEPPLPP